VTLALGIRIPASPVSSRDLQLMRCTDRYQIILVDRRGRETIVASYPEREE